MLSRCKVSWAWQQEGVGEGVVKTGGVVFTVGTKEVLLINKCGKNT